MGERPRCCVQTQEQESSNARKVCSLQVRCGERTTAAQSPNPGRGHQRHSRALEALVAELWCPRPRGSQVGRSSCNQAPQTQRRRADNQHLQTRVTGRDEACSEPGPPSPTQPTYPRPDPSRTQPCFTDPRRGHRPCLLGPAPAAPLDSQHSGPRSLTPAPTAPAASLGAPCSVPPCRPPRPGR